MIWLRFLRILKKTNTADQIPIFDKEAEIPNLYIASSLFLYDCYKKLTKIFEEHLFYVTGIELHLSLGEKPLQRLYIFGNICEFTIESASRFHAKGKIESTHLTLINLDNFGHRLYGLFHKHPGKGIWATFPSSIDLDTQERMERGGYPVIGAIFTEDGYVNFFSVRRKFEVEIYGEGVKHVQDKIFKLEICELSDKGNKTKS